MAERERDLVCERLAILASLRLHMFWQNASTLSQRYQIPYIYVYNMR